MALKSYTLPDRNWTVRNELVFAVVQAPTAEEAVKVALKALGFEHKPWLGRKLTVRQSTEEDLRRYAALAEAHRRSQPTATTAKRKTVHERLGLDQEPML